MFDVRVIDCNSGKTNLRVVMSRVRASEEDKARLQGELDKEKSLRAQAVSETSSAVQDAMSGKSVVGLASMLGVSPLSMEKVENASKRGSLQTTMFDDAATPAAKVCDQNAFVRRVVSTLTPVVERLCAVPKFKGGNTDVGGVASIILGKIARDKSAKSVKSRRKIDFGGSLELDSLLKELSEAWRNAFRNEDRDASARLLQLTLKAIPQRKGRVTTWLGPR